MEHKIDISVISTNDDDIPYEKLPITNDFIFGKVFGQRENCQELLRILLRDETITITQAEAQQEFRSCSTAKDIRLDIHVRTIHDDFDIEMQNETSPELFLRARYYQAMMDTQVLEKGKGYTSLPQNWIIFFITKDIFGRGLPVYTFRNCCEEKKDLYLDDRTVKIFYNVSRWQEVEDRPTRELLHFISSETVTNDFTRKLRRDADTARINRDWRKTYMDAKMSRILWIEQGMEQGIQMGILQEKKNSVRKMLKSGCKETFIAECLELPVETVRQWAEED